MGVIFPIQPKGLLGKVLLRGLDNFLVNPFHQVCSVLLWALCLGTLLQNFFFPLCGWPRLGNFSVVNSTFCVPKVSLEVSGPTKEFWGSWNYFNSALLWGVMVGVPLLFGSPSWFSGTLLHFLGPLGFHTKVGHLRC